MAHQTVVYVVSAHGFGHAARAAAVMEQLGRRMDVAFEVVTTIPEWFFAQSLSAEWRRTPLETDVGLVQTSPLAEDLEATVARLETFWRRLPKTAQDLARQLRLARPRLVVSDISPLGPAVARHLGVPVALVENFTWDWIYEGYEDLAPRLAEFGTRYAALVADVDEHIQCEPVCRPLARAVAVAPVARPHRRGRAATRRDLGIEPGDERPLICFTMGGFGWSEAAPRGRDDWLFVTLGGGSSFERRGNLVRLPDRSPVYPPDLVAAADAVVAKLGYSTVAECFWSGASLAWLGRERFPESPVLASFVQSRLTSRELPYEALSSGAWVDHVARLLAEPRRANHGVNGAETVATRLGALLDGDL
jgi:hypothetical protein